MIPKIIHRIWFGDNPVPPAYEAWWQGWQRQLPQCEFVTWTDKDIPRLPAVAGKIAEAQGMARKADIARYAILHQNGGVYLDCDIKPYHYYDFFTGNDDIIVCEEKISGECSIGFIAAVAGNGLLQKAVDTIATTPLNIKQTNEETGPVLWGSIVHKNPHKMLPIPAFYPYAWNEPYAAVMARDLSNTYGIHVWGASWVSEEDKNNKMVAAILSGDMASAEKRARACKQGGELAAILDLLNNIRSARTAETRIALSGMLSGMANISDYTLYSFDKACHHLLETDPNMVIWQIGAANGVLHDPLRSALVNFDPKAVLVEPNPYLFAQLRDNYAHNRNAVLLHAAFGATRGSISLNAVVPDKIAGRGLSPQALGVSSIDDAHIAATLRECMEIVDAPVMDVDQLCAAGANRMPDILVIETSGGEGEFLENILSRGAQPHIIHYTKTQQPKVESVTFEKILKESYICFTFQGSVAAYRKDFFVSYCTFLYAEYGYRNMFGNALKIIHGR